MNFIGHWWNPIENDSMESPRNSDSRKCITGMCLESILGWFIQRRYKYAAEPPKIWKTG